MYLKHTTAAQIAADILRVAQEQSIEPDAMSTRAYYKHGGIHSERQIKKCGGFPLIKRTFHGKDARVESEIRAMQGINTEVNKLRRVVGDTEHLALLVAQSVEKMPPIRLAYRPPKASPDGIQRAVSLVLSDHHVGAGLTVEENLRKFGAEEEAAMLDYVMRNTCEYKTQYRRETELNLFVLGDMIENNLHGASSAIELHFQICRSIHLLRQAVAMAAASFAKVTVLFAVGNHGRDLSVHQKRGIHQKYNSIETTIYYAIKSACRTLGNVTFIQPQTAWIDHLVMGHRFFGAHGDTHLATGNPGGSLNIKRLMADINQINASLKDKDEYKVFLAGHYHQALVTQLPNGAHLILNGAGTPPGSFAQHLNIMESQMTQVMFETTADHAVGDFRFVTVPHNHKGKVIKPWLSLEDY